MRRFLREISLSLSVAGALSVSACAPGRMVVYLGTYTGGESEGIYRYALDETSGKLTFEGVTTGVKNPSFLAIHSDGRHLYCVCEISDYRGGETGSVRAFSIEATTGDLKPLNEQSSGGAGPCHLVVDASGKNVLVANYGGGSVSVVEIEPDGRLGAVSSHVQHHGSSVNPGRQKGPHAHSIHVDAANRFAFAADLGLDKILVYRFDAGVGTIAANDPPAATVKPGAGPRHFAFHPSGDSAYVINELDSTVTAFSYDAERGVLTEIQTISTLPADFEGRSHTAEVQVHPGGKFLYGSNRGHDSIAVFSIDPERGTLKMVETEPTQGKTPRNFGIDPSGKFLLAANQGSDTVVVFHIDPETGALEPSGYSVETPRPVCVKFLRLGG